MGTKTAKQKLGLSTLPSHEFWRFSLKLYSKPIVKNICLELQNQYGLNINLILFCCWLAASSRGQITTVQLKKIINAIKAWHQGITEGLRNLRYTLSNLPEHKWAVAIHKEVLTHELIAEHIEQLLLVEEFNPGSTQHLTLPQKRTDCINNLNNYFSCQKVKLESDGYRLLEDLLQEIFQLNTKQLKAAQLSLPF